MKRDAKKLDNSLERHLGWFNSPSGAQLDASRERIQDRLTSQAPAALDGPQLPMRKIRGASAIRKTLVAAVAAAAVIAGVLLSANLFHKADSLATVEIADGPLYRVSGDKLQSVRPGDPIPPGQTVRSNGGTGNVIALADGSRIEMRAQSELALEEADDGIRIHLSNGSVIVNAAPQRSGHLYVRTKDVTVSVVGTVFLVESAEAGSRVAVIQGEVHVQQGATSKTLLPGEQVTTAPSMKPISVAEEVSWSRNAGTHIALLQQAIAVASPIAPPPAQSRQTFDEISIRPIAPTRAPVEHPVGAECRGRIQLDPQRLAITTTTLYNLIALANGIDCRDARLGELITGGPEWVKSDRFNFDAAIPDGSPIYTQQEFNNHNAPLLETMLQTMLADRFRLVVHRQTRETLVYNLVVAGNGKLKVSEIQSEKDLPAPRADEANPLANRVRTLLGNEFVDKGMLLGGGTMGMIIDDSGSSATMKAVGVPIPGLFSLLYTEIKDRMIVDKTNIKSRIDFQVQFAPVYGFSGPLPQTTPRAGPSLGPSLFEALQEQAGLKLEAARVPMEILVIDRAEKPAN